MGRQFANDVATPSPISVSRDKYQNEVPADREAHTNSTAGEGAFSWDSNHYSDDWMGGNKPYGVTVDGSPKTSVQVVDNDKANRGPES